MAAGDTIIYDADESSANDEDGAGFKKTDMNVTLLYGELAVLSRKPRDKFGQFDSSAASWQG